MFDWHNRYLQQARWTKPLRTYLYAQAGLLRARHVLDVGCGTGVLEVELNALAPQIRVTGLDILAEALTRARGYAQNADWAQADAHAIPFPSASFDISLCHFLLLWFRDPIQVVTEMKRVTQPGGAVLALAEPDYGGRIDYPDELAALGAAQRNSLLQQGADPLIGRRLGEIFSQAGLVEIETGVTGGQWRNIPTAQELDLEWAVLESDLAGEFSPAEIVRLRSLDEGAYRKGSRMLFVPTFYAWGKTPT
jgi:ubiquinone/menaquinone biosynthesis C-methylase UbiE